MANLTRRISARSIGSTVRSPIWLIAVLWLSATAALAQNSLRLVDYAALPMTGSINGASNAAYLARASFLAEEPGGGFGRLFVNDLNGPLYILDKSTRTFGEYLNFNGRGAAPGLFDRFSYSTGQESGLVTFEFDPAYASNGKFYTVHTEEPTPGLGSQIPDTTNYANLNVSSFGVTTSVDAPGNTSRQTVLVEWTDTNINNTTFEGTARELLRMDMLTARQPMADITFNPTAGPDDPDWRVMYVAVGDGAAGESSNTPERRTPQILSALGGKILRIRPDNADANTPLTASTNTKYYIPNDNPFVSLAGTNSQYVMDEIYALGLHNPHHLSWDVDPANPAQNHLFVSDVGLNTWEEVNIVQPGRNFGYSQREGSEELDSDDFTSSLPNPDTILNQHICVPSGFTSCSSNGTVTPIYPVIQYGHARPADGPQPAQNNTIAGDSISSGFIYRGSLVPELSGKYVFGDVTTGRILYSDLAEMLAADDSDPATTAAIHELNILWDDPNDAPNAGEELYGTISTATSPGSPHTVQVRGPMFQVVDSAYHARGGLDVNLPGAAGITSPYGRADIRLEVDAAGELYILSKSDGMIRAVISPDRLLLTVDPVTGRARLANHSGFDITIDGYSIASDFGSLLPSDSDWNSLADQGALNWQETALSDGLLSESSPTPLMIANGTEYDMGWLFDSSGEQKLTFEFNPVGGPEDVLFGIVEFEAVGLPGDYNDDNIVDAADYTVWRNTLGSPTDRRADGDGDHVVDADDYGVWKLHYGESVDPGGGGLADASVPEPHTSVLMLLAAVIGSISRWRRRIAG